MSTTRRQNGWQTPFNRYQINLWIVFPLIAVHYFAFLYPMLWNLTTEIVVTIIFGTAFVCASVAGCICTTVNPADNFVVSCNTEGHEDKDRVYCYLCEINVGLTSKHCRYCDKCVVGFDHHCVWLNTCIGSKNYHWFFITVIASALFTVTSTVLSLALLIDSFNTPDRISSLSYFTPITLHGVQALLFLSVMVFLGWTSMVCQLGGFHIYLVSRGITTYDFIVEQQQKSTERNKQKEIKLLEKQSGTTTAPEATDCCGGSGCNQPQKPPSPLQTDGQVDQYTQLASNNNMFASPSPGLDASSAGTMAIAKSLGGDIEQCMMDKGPGLGLPSDNADQCGKAVRAVGGGDGDDALDAIRPSSSNSNSTPTLPLTISNHGYPAMTIAATAAGGGTIGVNASSENANGGSGGITRNVNAAEFYPGQYISHHAGVSEEVGVDQVDVVQWSSRPPPPLAFSPATTNPTASSTGGLPGAPRARAPAVTTSSSSSAAAVAVIVSAPSSSSSAIATATAPSSSSSAPSSSLVVQRVDKGQAKRQMAASMALARSTSASLATTPAATPWTSPLKPPTAQLGPQPHHLQPQHPQQQFPLRTSTNPSVHHNITTVSGGISAYPSATSVNTLGTFSVDTVPPPAPPAYSPHASPSTRAATRENAAAAAREGGGGGGGVITTPGIILVPLQVVMDHNLDESLRPI